MRVRIRQTVDAELTGLDLSLAPQLGLLVRVARLVGPDVVHEDEGEAIVPDAALAAPEDRLRQQRPMDLALTPPATLDAQSRRRAMSTSMPVKRLYSTTLSGLRSRTAIRRRDRADDAMQQSS